MTFRDELEAAQARIRTLSAELEAEREQRQAAEAARRAAEAARDEARRGRHPGQEQRSSLPWILGAVVLVLGGLAAVMAYTQHQQRRQAMLNNEIIAQRERYERELEALRARHERELEALRALPAVPPAIRADEIEPPGTLDPEVIRRVVQRYANQVKHCYERALSKDPALGGKVVVEVTIGTSGRVEASEIESSTINNKTVERCIVAATRRWRFPQPEGGPVVVHYPFILQSSEE
jgi:TonB family protein